MKKTPAQHPATAFATHVAWRPIWSAMAVWILEYGSYLSMWRPRTALKMWTGWPTFPMVFVKGTLIGGYEELNRLAESGELDRMLDG